MEFRRIKERKEQFLRIDACGVKVENIIWVSELGRNGLYKIDLEHQRIEFVCEFPVIKLGYLFLDVVYHEGELFFIPYRSNDLVIYNLKNKKFRKIPIKNTVKERYVFGIIDSESLYLFPEFSERIIKINLIKNKITNYERIIKELKQKLCLENEPLFFAKYLYNDRIFLPLYKKNILVEYYYKSEKYEFISLEENENIGFIACIGIKEILYLLDRNGTVYEYNMRTRKKKKIFSLKDGTLDPYISIEFYNDELWLIPYKKDSIVVYDLKKKEVCFVEIPDKFLSYEIIYSSKDSDKMKFSKSFSENGKIWIYPHEIDYIIEIDMEKRAFNGFLAYLPTERDDTIIGLTRKDQKFEKKDKSSYGKEIWKTIKNI